MYQSEQPKTEFVTTPLKPYKPINEQSGKIQIPQAIQFQNMISSFDPLEIEVKRWITLGRTNDVTVDLSRMNAKKMGVSRLHGSIYVHNSFIVFRDEGSQNGSFINDLELYPHRDYPLHNQDIIKLGGLTLQVTFVY